jgi:hypothetical protein
MIIDMIPPYGAMMTTRLSPLSLNAMMTTRLSPLSLHAMMTTRLSPLSLHAMMTTRLSPLSLHAIVREPLGLLVHLKNIRVCFCRGAGPSPHLDHRAPGTSPSSTRCSGLPQAAHVPTGEPGGYDWDQMDGFCGLRLGPRKLK